MNGTTIRYGAGQEQTRSLPLGACRREISVSSWPTLRPSVRSGVRVDVADSSGKSSTFLHVLSADGAVTSVARADKAGDVGVDIAFADGRTATVRFSTAGSGGHLERRDAEKQAVIRAPCRGDQAAPPCRVPRLPEGEATCTSLFVTRVSA